MDGEGEFGHRRDHDDDVMERLVRIEATVDEISDLGLPSLVMSSAQRVIDEIGRQADRIIAAIANNHTNPATGFRLLIGGRDMGTFNFTIDDTEQVQVGWTDRLGEPVDAPAGDSVSLTSADTSIVDNPVVGSPLVIHKAGTVDITGTAVDATGAALPGFEAQTATLVIAPGTATAFTVSVNGGAPTPVASNEL